MLQGFWHSVRKLHGPLAASSVAVRAGVSLGFTSTDGGESILRTTRRHLRWVPPIALGIALVLVTGCGGDDSSGPALGNLVITTISTGADIDGDGYTVTVDNTLSQNISANGSATFTNLATGDHSVELSGLADNCSVDGTNPRTVNVSNSGGSSTFNVVCNSLTGNVESITATTGVSIDPNGYTLEIDGNTEGPIGVNDTVTVDDLDVGDHTVELLDVAPNCTVSGNNPRTVTVPDDVPDPNGGTGSTTFAVNCVQALGNLVIWTETTGIDLDPDGYTVTVDGSTNQNVATNGNVTFTNLDVGIHSVELTGIAANCSVSGANPRNVDVAFGANADTFQIACETTGSIVFDSDGPGNREIYIMDGDGGNPSRLTNNAAVDRMPVFSGDGTQIAFSSNRDGQDDIWVMNRNGTGVTQLTSTFNNIEPAWSWDGSRILFTQIRSGGYDVFVMNANGSNPTNLTQDASSRDDQAEWSPDGTEIVFRSNRDGGFGVWVMNADGSNPRKLTNGTAGNPTWSPDGTKIAFVSDRSGNLDIWVMDAATGANQVNLTQDPASDGEPAWSPTGSQIVFWSNRSGSEDIWTMKADGSDLQRLTDASGTDKWPSWSRQ